MLYIKFQTSEHSGSEDDFNFFIYFYGLNLEPPGARLSWTQGPLFEQNWQRITRHAMLHTKFQVSDQSGSGRENF